jgi:CDP-glucose 4,6-dehydratase
VGDLAAAIVREWKSGSWLDISDKNDLRLHEAGWLRLSCDKAHFMLPWNAVLSFDETIAMTVKWFRYFYEYADTNMYQYCVHQIRDYTRLAAHKEQMWAS